ncbi:MAG: hypothetical protein IKJ44_00405 [Elusimicrobiaceae bacterium]|nr:hypothetical protein [Elusimicrobiaceae bacterium]MBR3898716.1 hypothetical protein [Elusimicrobiaceae bacterium]
MRKESKVYKLLKDRKGQTAVEYIITAFMLFGAFLAFYALYSNLVPQQFDQGAKLILTEYNAN